MGRKQFLKTTAFINPGSLIKSAKNTQKLVDKIERQLKREALSKAASPMRKAAAKNVHRESQALKKSLKIKITTYKGSELIIATIGPDRKAFTVHKGRKVRPRNYAHIEEFGSVKNPGGHPFMRPAFDSMKATSFKIYTQELKKGLPRVAKRIFRSAR
jgi:HK97 gp10 family phage protein